MKKISTVIVVLLGILFSFMVNAEVVKFKSVPKMIADFGDYDEENGTFKMFTSKEVPNFQLSNRVVKGDLESVILESVKRDILYGIYRAFIHTDYDTVQVTSIPSLLDFKNPSKHEYLQQYKATLKVKRNKVLQVAKKLFQVNSLNDLVSLSKYNVWMWTTTFNKGHYNDQGSPTLDIHYAALQEISEPIIEKVVESDGLYSLNINATPSDSTVKVMNIPPKYKPGIKLKAGKYDVSVSKKGYGKWREWVEIVDSDLSVDVVLESKYSCNKRYCKNMNSCEEAYYHLNNCGGKRLDRDGDGVPCEAICPGG